MVGNVDIGVVISGIRLRQHHRQPVCHHTGWDSQSAADTDAAAIARTSDSGYFIVG